MNSKEQVNVYLFAKERFLNYFRYDLPLYVCDEGYVCVFDYVYFNNVAVPESGWMELVLPLFILKSMFF